MPLRRRPRLLCECSGKLPSSMAPSFSCDVRGRRDRLVWAPDECSVSSSRTVVEDRAMEYRPIADDAAARFEASKAKKLKEPSKTDDLGI